jgi:predicted aldo/keto reductase-like oxidoreductase
VARERETGIDRRAFLKVTAATGLGLSLAPWGAFAASDATAPGPPHIRGTRTLGRTGLRISDIGFGSSSLSEDEGMVHHALDRGVDYFDTAESYQGGRAELVLGRALKGARSRVTLASKVQAGAHDSRDDIMRALDGSLSRLQTDHIDIYFNHAVNDVARLKNEEWSEFAARAKQQGKIRFTGMSGHGGRLVECLDYALDHDLVDAILVGYNFGQDPGFVAQFTKDFDFVAVNNDLPRVLSKAKQKGVGVIAMKTLRGARLNDMRPYERGGATFAQAAFRWVLANQSVDALIVTMKSTEQIDEYLGASGATATTAADLGILRRYEALNGRIECRYGCNDCVNACPLGVPIADVMRVRMYAEDYDDPDLARSTYRTLRAPGSPTGDSGADLVKIGSSDQGVAAACLSCAHRTCQSSCGYGLDVAELAIRAHLALVE